MKVLELSQSPSLLSDVLKIARQETLILRQPNHGGFVLAPIDSFDLEVELLRHNKEFMAYLDELSSEEATISLAEVEEELGGCFLIIVSSF